MYKLLMIAFAILLIPSLACAQAATPSRSETDSSLQYLLQSISDTDWKVAQDAKSDLVKAGNKAVPLLLEIAAGRKEGSPEAAIEVLGKIGDASAVEPLIGILQTSTSGSVRRAAAEALGWIGDPRAVDALMIRVGPTEKYLNTRYAALQALGRIKDPRAVTFLMMIMNGDPYLESRNFAADALDEIAGTQFGHDHHRRMEWIRANHPEWLELNEEQWSIHPGMIWMAGAVVVFALVGIWLIRSTWNSFRHG